MPAPTPRGTIQFMPSDGIGEASWAAAPWLTLFKMPTVHVVRDPIKVISKLWNMKFTVGANKEGIEALVPGLELWAGPDREAIFWLRWTNMADLAEATWRVEDPPVAGLLAVLKRAQIPPNEWRAAEALAEVPKEIGTVEHADPVGYDDLDSQVRAAVEKKARLYGYL